MSELAGFGFGVCPEPAPNAAELIAGCTAELIVGCDFRRLARVKASAAAVNSKGGSGLSASSSADVLDESVTAFCYKISNK